MNNLFPIFLKLENQPVLVVGGGVVAEQKVTALLTSQAAVTVISPEVSEKIDRLAQQSKIRLARRGYRQGDVEGFVLIFGATNVVEVQRAIYQEAKQKNIPVNIVDVPELCTFYLSSVFQDGDLKIAISTNGKSPTLGKIIREKIGAEFSNGYPKMLEKVGAMRPLALACLPDYESRKKFFENIVQSELQNDFRNGKAADHSRVLSNQGRVYLVGAGPGDPELISVKGLRLLQTAAVVVYDAHVHPQLLAQAPAAEKIYVGKKAGTHCIAQEEINHILISKAHEGKIVVRLKAGDPFIFGRGGEELQALREAGVETEIVPGITAGVGVPVSLGLPLTHRRYSSSVAFVTGHEDPTKSDERIDWKSAAAMDTLVIYMGIRRIEQIVGKLIANGRSPRQTVAVIFSGTLPEQIVITGTLQSIASKVKRYDLEAPGLIVIGEVVRFLDEHVPSSAVDQQQEMLA
jgi:uroporphyrin-III C-methyltransferase/precorrin-2 dehydrogenase/sirohydrochlorin ferrochelatase